MSFVVIGGQAESLMGSPRITYDTDICFERTVENLPKLASALNEMDPSLRGAPPELPFVLDERALSLGGTFTFQTKHGDVDILVEVEPIGTFRDVMKRVEMVDFDGAPLPLICLDDLIRVKEYHQREKDRQSLIQLAALRKERLEAKQDE
ncbi:MAG: hypothetical protein AAF743_04840 [Planctomycetota bacterium]